MGINYTFSANAGTKELEQKSYFDDVKETSRGLSDYTDVTEIHIGDILMNFHKSKCRGNSQRIVSDAAKATDIRDFSSTHPDLS